MDIEKENKLGTKRKDTSTITTTPSKKQKRSIIEYKNKLVFKQKSINLSKHTKTLQSLLEFHQFLSTLNDNLTQIPNEHLDLISILVQESDKQLPDLIKHVKSQIKPSNFNFDIQQHALESAIQTVAFFKNYGIEGDQLPSKYKLFKWEVKNLDDLPQDALDNIKQRRFDREFSQQKLLESISGLDHDDFESVLSQTAQTPSADKVKKDEERIKKEEEKRKKEEEKQEEKRRKEEEKLEEKRRKEEEKLKKEHEKQLEKNRKEEEKNSEKQKAQKQSNAFKGFFSKVVTPKKPTSPSKDVSDFEKTFKSFHLKQGFDIAPINRFKPAQFDDFWGTIDKTPSDSITLESSLASIPKWKLIKKNAAVADKHAPLHSKIAPPIDLRSVMQQLSEAEVGGDENKAKEILESFKTRFRGKLRHKLLKYHEDYRPGWWGTCTKSSSTVGPRRPFAKDALQFDYSYDSEVEWGEEEPDEKGEEIQSQPGSDDEKDKDNESDADSWLVSDSEDVGLEDMDLDNMDIPDLREKVDDPIENAIAAERRDERVKAKKKNNKSRKPNQPSKPYVSGLKWESDEGQITYPPFISYQIKFFNDADVSINPKEFVSEVKPTLVTQASSTTAATVTNNQDTTFKTPSSVDKQDGQITSIPKTHLMTFVQTVENSSKSRVLLIEELRERFSGLNGPKISKVSIAAMLSANAKRDGKKANSAWHVSDNVKEQI
ncbi:hypothetical protein E3Q22_00295 [Wallemia mellicola]|uniref:Chromatin assembly factor 1 subunit A n=2 Tax=Wallemia mellicola TaxID=1708541 RepID=I4YGU4_WALMC|nr:hypothetical protein WALSEDRAFT_27321 [Wallemia mellicola CBS 633.66]TIB82464.1 hypothetical protein E3Q22_00295 [Wallemia mellicola]EIM23186.1 hypothetical protein WALSEDRAFT_27321 [Wallemia mellicola CBS 633.66]TIB84903.1 hypothetical protein E3Q21_02224 [Wallemia mellicola]TIC00120.1 hypothetical protein E3Q18_01294 [Wallemia mellicola]TIC48786.1 hypothetical protein E3Q06_02213 [Wallemia mellicola]|eukprot:XP_006956580.1 hypothetical protein WALSEDRAFT_27321 [Wallemia mellicola CBS 633.66]